ncbi:hypothetical protein [Marinomonas sp. 2405UD68-3]|uniref:hypothetical protein n=1 Tax=Marinomonas sp. 2405UD68-3 TaxID=3391835 RepID=UPI0039C8E433
MGKNDLSSLKIKQEKKLPDETNINLLEKTADSVNESENKIISLRITTREFLILKEKAGMVPLGRYLKHQLREKTDVFK